MELNNLWSTCIHGVLAYGRYIHSSICFACSAAGCRQSNGSCMCHGWVVTCMQYEAPGCVDKYSPSTTTHTCGLLHELLHKQKLSLIALSIADAVRVPERAGGPVQGRSWGRCSCRQWCSWRPTASRPPVGRPPCCPSSPLPPRDPCSTPPPPRTCPSGPPSSASESPVPRGADRHSRALSRPRSSRMAGEHPVIAGRHPSRQICGRQPSVPG